MNIAEEVLLFLLFTGFHLLLHLVKAHDFALFPPAYAACRAVMFSVMSFGDSVHLGIPQTCVNLSIHLPASGPLIERPSCFSLLVYFSGSHHHSLS